MKPSCSTFRNLLLALLLSAVFCHAASANQTDKQAKALENYYNECLNHLHTSDVLKMADTLDMRAQTAANNHFVLMAEIVRLEYYYHQNDKDKILEYVGSVKRMSREMVEPKYYYIVWGSRLITFYLKNGMSNHALLEAQNMLREAQAENFQTGIIECYKAMGNIYTVQSNPELAAEYYGKMIEMIEAQTPDDTNLPIYYSSLAEGQLLAGNIEAAEKSLDKIEQYFSKADTITPYQRLSLDRGRIKLFLKKGDLDAVRKTYEHIEHLFAEHKDLAIYTTALYIAQLDYYMATNQYERALPIIDSLQRGRPNSETRTYLLLKKGDISFTRKDFSTAAQCFREYALLTDSVRRISTQKSANEIAGLLGLQQLEKEKQQLQVDIQQRRLKTTYWTIGLLALALAVGTITVIRLYRLNGQLKEAEQLVLHQNSQLQQAKEQAEQASSLKSRFIQDISHEVRTPLNAIVGFSQVVCELCNTPESREYAGIIATNSDDLLRLFNDVLELSSLDQLDTLSYNARMDMNASCRTALEQITPLIKEGVGLTFRTSDDELQIHTNPTYVSRILASLLHNAAKYTATGEITLECTADRAKGVIRYSVTDTGPGIPAEKLVTIFERFKKIDSFAQGTGLGLALSRTISEKLGGTLTIDSSYTFGCRVLLTLPLSFPEESNA